MGGGGGARNLILLASAPLKSAILLASAPLKSAMEEKKIDILEQVQLLLKLRAVSLPLLTGSQ